MASIFLSYAREDAPKAKALARWLERSGHAVWWDRHIHGGSEFSGEIEQALRSADIVVVLWSEASIRSAWVRDEAAEGRDSGRLLPLLLDASTAPLGFRQLQSLDVSAWSGRGNPPGAQEIVKAINARTGGSAAAAQRYAPAQIAWWRRPALYAASLALLALAAAGAWLLGETRSKASEAPVLAVLPFSDLSPERDKAYFAEGVAEAILTVLAKEPGIRVIGRSTAQQLQDAGPDAAKMRRELGVTHVLEGSARSVGDQLRMSVRLVNAADGQQLWAEEYQRRLNNIFAIQDEIGRAVAQRLKGSFGQAAAQQLTSADAYTLYLAARAKMRDRRMSSLRDALNMARRVIAADPNFASGHALYAELVWQLSNENYGTIPIQRVRTMAIPHARRAIQLAPGASEGYAALGVLLTGEDAVGSLSKAIELDPSRSELRLWLARAHERLIQNNQALAQLKAGAEMDPLFGPVIWNYVWWLAASEQYADAEEVISKYERRGGSRAVAARMRSEVRAFYGGNYVEGVREGLRALQFDPEAPIGAETLAWHYRMLGFRREAAPLSGNLPPYSRLFSSGETPRLLSLVRQDGAKVWTQGDSWVAVDVLATKRDWKTVAFLYDRRPPDAAPLCQASNSWEVQMLINIAMALKEQRRSGEASRLLTCAKSLLEVHSRGPIRSAQMAGGVIDYLSAQVHALEGQPQHAFALLKRSVARGMRTPYGTGLSESAALDAYRSLPEYRGIDTRLKQLAAHDRGEVLKLLAALQPARRMAG